jgi:hypothetical protein
MKKLAIVAPLLGFVAGIWVGYDRDAVLANSISQTSATTGVSSAASHQPNSLSEVRSRGAGSTAAFDAIDSEKALPGKLRRLDEMLSHSGTEQYPEIWRQIRAAKIGTEMGERMLTDLLFEHWMQKAPDQALEEAYTVKADGRAMDHLMFFRSRFRSWASRDRAAADAYARTTFAGNNQFAGISTWIISDLDELASRESLKSVEPAAHFGSLVGSGATWGAFSATLREWAKTAPAEAVQAAWTRLPQNPPKGIYRVHVVQELFGAWYAQDPGALEAWVAEQMKSADGAELGAAYVRCLIQQEDFDRAKAYSTNLPEGKERTNALAQTAEALVRQRPSDAGAFMQSLSASDLRDLRLYNPAMEAWASNEPAQAAEFVTRHLATALESALKNGPAEASRLGDDAAQWLTPWLATDPRAAADYLLSLPAACRPHLEQPLVSAFCRRDPEGAAKWTEELRQRGLGTGPLSMAAARWAMIAPEQAGQWVRDMPPGPSQVAAATGMIYLTLSFNPEQAAAWLPYLPDLESRNRILIDSVREWKRRDRDAAAAWVESSPSLTPSDREALRSGLRSR